MLELAGNMVSTYILHFLFIISKKSPQHEKHKQSDPHAWVFNNKQEEERK